jgi:hypothetical protein
MIKACGGHITDLFFFPVFVTVDRLYPHGCVEIRFYTGVTAVGYLIDKQVIFSALKVQVA